MTWLVFHPSVSVHLLHLVLQGEGYITIVGSCSPSPLPPSPRHVYVHTPFCPLHQRGLDGLPVSTRAPHRKCSGIRWGCPCPGSAGGKSLGKVGTLPEAPHAPGPPATPLALISYLHGAGGFSASLARSSFNRIIVFTFLTIRNTPFGSQTTVF